MWFTLLLLACVALDNLNSATFSSFILTCSVATLQLSAWSFLKHPNMFLPQGLCHCCFLSLEWSSPTFSQGLLLHFILDFRRTLPNHCVQTESLPLRMFLLCFTFLYSILIWYHVLCCCCCSVVEKNVWTGGMNLCFLITNFLDHSQLKRKVCSSRWTVSSPSLGISMLPQLSPHFYYILQFH